MATKPKPKYRVGQRVVLKMHETVHQVRLRHWDGTHWLYCITRQPRVSFREYELRPPKEEGHAK